MSPWLRSAGALAAALLAAAGSSLAQEPPPAPELVEFLPLTRPAAQAGLVALRPIRLRYAHPETPLFHARATDSPAGVRALYVNAWAFGSQKFWTLLRLADSTEINALVIDVKDDTGCPLYPSGVLVAVEIGANRCARASSDEARAKLDTLRAHSVYAIARIVVAKDPLLARGKPQWAVRHAEGGLWRDRLGFAWVDAYHDSVWIYAAELAREAVELGFHEVQFDYVRFPDEPAEVLASARFGARRNGETKRAAVRRQLALLQARVRELEVPFTVDVFGLTTAATGDVGVGQVWEDLVAAADVVLPMVYPSHYRRGMYNIGHPNSEPYRTVRRALKDALDRNERLGGTAPASVRPYLQAFTLGRPRYTPEHIREQIRATEDLGLDSWVLWNPQSVYQRGSLRPYPPEVRTAGSTTPSAPRPTEINQQ